jgi:hypothetical protein
MDEIKAQELFDFFNQEGYDLGDFNNFSSALNNEVKRKELHEFFNQEGYDVGLIEDFKISTGVVEGVKKKDEPASTSQEEVMESVTPTEQEEVGSLVSSAPSPLDERKESERVKAKEYEQSTQERQFDFNRDTRTEQSIDPSANVDRDPSVPRDIRATGYDSEVKTISDEIREINQNKKGRGEFDRALAEEKAEESGANKKLEKLNSALVVAKEQYEKDKEYTATLIESEGGSLEEKQQLESKAFDEISLEDKLNLGTKEDIRFTQMEDSDLIGPRDLNIAELEVESIFAEKGYDYKQIRDDYNVYEESNNEIEFIESAPLYVEELTKEEKKLYGDKYYINGTRREDIKTFTSDLQNQVDIRFDSVMGDEYQRLREDSDIILDKIYRKESAGAASSFKSLKSSIAELNEQSISTFGVPISDINTLEFTSQADVDKANQIVNEAIILNSTQDLIAEQYIEASTWFDVKFDKQLTGDVIENWEGFKNNLSVGWSRGQAAEEILKSALGFSDLEDEATLEEVANAIAEYSKQGQTGKTNRVLDRWAKAKGFDEGWSVFADNPMELMVTMTGESLSQMSPYALKMVAAGAATGVVVGGGIGATGFVTGPGGVVTTGAGALTGLGYGVKTSMAAAAYSMEYTNSVFEAMANKDPNFDITDPASVQEGLLNPEVWAEGFEIGTKRGIPIAIVEYLSAGLAGKFLTAGRLASKPLKAGAFVAERALFDPASEAFGEFMAQVVSGQDVDMKEIISEAIGSMGTLAPVALFNIAKETRSFNKITIAQDLATLEGMAKEKASPSRITTWANNMEKAGKISPEQNQRIQINIGLKKEAQDAFVKQSYFTEKSSSQQRMMELLSAKKELSSDANRRAAFKDKIKEIDNEIAGLIGEENLKPIEEQTNFPSIINDGLSGGSDIREGVSRYTYKGKDITKEDLLSKIDKISLRGLLKLRINKDDELQKKLDNKIDELKKPLTEKEIESIEEEVSPETEAEVTKEAEVKETKPEVEVEAVAATKKEEGRLKRRVIKAKEDFYAATDIGGKAKALINFLNNATISKESVSQEDMYWYEQSKAELEAEGYVFDGEIGREVSDNEITEIKNRKKSDQVPKGVVIIDKIVKPRRIVDGKQTGRPIYDVIEGTGTTAERDALAAEVESIKDSMTPQNMKETTPKLSAARKALKEYDNANFISPIQTEINTQTETAPEQQKSVEEKTNQVNAKETEVKETKPEVEAEAVDEKGEIAPEVEAETSTEGKVFRAGDLITKPEQIGKFEGGDRSTGHFGTGFYFFGKKDDAVKRSKKEGGNDRVVSELDISDYNLAKGTLKLHDKLKDINNNLIKAGKIVKDINPSDIIAVANILGIQVESSEQNPYKKFDIRNNKQYDALVKELGKDVVDKGMDNLLNFEQKQEQKVNELAKGINSKLNSKGNIDTPSTLVMKALGFEGVNSTGTDLDTGIYGTVVYDIKETAPEVEAETENVPIAEDNAENETANEKLTEEDNTEQEPIIKTIESKGESTDEAGLNEAIEQADEVINEALGITRKSIKEIETDEARFQGREKLLEDKVGYIAENWSDADQDPIHIWTDPNNGKTYVLSGHHRFEGAKRAKRKNVKVVDRTLEFDEKEAIKFAKERANANRAMETPLVRATALKNKRENGDSKKEIEAFLNQEGSNKTNILNLSFLNLGGLLVQKLKEFNDTPDVQTQDKISTIADWIGYVRRFNKKLTDAHERELFDFLTNKEQSKRITNRSDFSSKVSSLAKSMFFDYETPLNIARFKNTTEGEKQYDKEVSEQDEVVKSLEQKEKELRARFNDPNNEKFIDPNASDYDVIKERANKLLTKIESDLKIERAKLLDIYRNKGKYSRAGLNQGGLFDEPSAPKETAPKKKSKEERVKIADAKIEDIANAIKGIDSILGVKIKADDIDGLTKSGIDMNGLIDIIADVVKQAVKAGIKIDDAIKKTIEHFKGNIDFDVDVDDIKARVRVVNNIDGIIEKIKSRNVKDNTNPDVILKGTLAYLQTSKIYINSTDTQREEMVRYVRNKIGLLEKKSITPEAAIKIASKKLGLDIETPSKITLTQKQAIASQIKSLNRGAKDAIKALKEASKQISEQISEMVAKGKITTKQSAAIIRRFSKVNMLSDASIDSFTEYMSRVFKNANYAEEISTANKYRKQALKNVSRKIGVADAVSTQLNRIFSINPSLIPESVFNEYLSLVKEFGERTAILNLSAITEVEETTEKILEEIDVELSKVPELKERFDSFDGKVYDSKTGKLDYAKTIKAMLDEGLIDDVDLDVMQKYKSNISPKEEKVKKTEAEIIAEKKEVIDVIAKLSALQASQLPSRFESEIAKTFEKLINNKDVLDNLSLEDLKQIEKLYNNINNGYLPHLVQVMNEKMSAELNSNVLSGAIESGKVLPISKVYANIKSKLTKKGAILEAIRRNPLFYIDQIFGNFKSKPIFNNLFKDSAKSNELFTSKFKRIRGKIDAAETAVAKSFGLDGNKVLMSKFKQMAYMIQLEHDSNPNNKETKHQAAAYIKKTIESIYEGKTNYSNTDAEMLEELLDKFTDKKTGEINLKKIYDSFNEAEKKSIKVIQEVNYELGPMAVQTASIIRGTGIKARNNYVHLNVLSEEGTDPNSNESFVKQYLNSMNPSTKAKSLIERKGVVSALDFDVYASASRGAKGVLLDFYMTAPIRTSRRTLNATEKKLKGNKERIDSETREKFNAVRDAYEEVLEDTFTNAYQQNTLFDDAINWAKKNGYRAILASGKRWIAELSSNTAFAIISNPKAFVKGSKIGVKFLNSDAAPKAMENLRSKQTNRIYPNEDMSGRMVDTNLMNQSEGIKGGKARGRYANKLLQVWNRTGKKYSGAVATLADGLISTPDKIVMRPMWFGSFASEFENITGVKPDLDKIAENDSDYMSKYQNELEKSTEIADETSVMTGSTANPFLGILKGNKKQGDGGFKTAFNTFNNFMTTFLIYEYVTARTGIMNAVGKGHLSKRKGAALIAASTTRMIMYTMILKLLTEGMKSIMASFRGEDEEEKDTKSLDKTFGQSVVSSVLGLVVGRDFGNATKAILNMGIEEVNKEFLDVLRDGEYDPYKDALAYQVIPTSDDRGTNLGEVVMKFTGPYSPIAKTVDFGIKILTQGEKKTDEKKETRKKETYIRLPLEILGNAGFVPMYKDVRTLVLDDLYNSVNEADKLKESEAAKKQAAKDEKNNFDYDRENMSDKKLKNMYPDLYRKYITDKKK